MMTTTYEIKPSTELMENYLQASVMAPQRAFRAAQSSDGRALLFSIGSEDGGSPLNVTVEQSGERHAWATVGLGGGSGQLPCQLFAVNPQPDSIHLAMALRDGKNDTLHLGRLTVAADDSVTPPTWTALPYDDPTTPRQRVEIVGLSLSQATDGEYVVVDVLRDPDSPARHLTRYYIDPAKTSGQAWHLHDVAIDINPEGYVSSLGRRDDEDVDGIYVGGQVDGHPQLVYAPLLVVDGRPGQRPKTAYLNLTANGDQIPDAIAACPNADNTTDLYVAANGTLYRFASSNQHHEAVATVAATSPFLTTVRDLFTFDDDDRVVVWGRNADNVAFYLACPRAKLDEPGAWSLPLPLLSGVQHVSPFVNRGNRANIIYAHTHDNQLKVGLKSPETRAWTWTDIVLPLADTQLPARKISSYTTRVQVFDDQKRPASNLTMALTAQNISTVQVNHLYYQVGPTPIHVPVDPNGCVTVIEAVPGLTGTQFGFSVASTPTQVINPMDKAFRKATDLQTVDQLKNAEVVRYVNGVRQPAQKLIGATVDDATLRRVAHMNQQCAHVYQDPAKGPTSALQAAMAAADQPFTVPDDAPVVDGGDLFQFLETASADPQVRAQVAQTPTTTALSTTTAADTAVGESFWDMLVRWFEGAWEFVVKIGEAIYRCVLELIEDVVAAVRWVFDKIVTAIEDFIHFLSFLFEWDDFKRTKNVIKNVSTAFINYEIGQIPVLRRRFDELIDKAVAAIDAWAGVLPDVGGLGEAASNPPSHSGSTDGPDAPGSMLSHHFQGNVGNATHRSAVPTPPPTSLFDVLKDAYEQESAKLGDATNRLDHLFRVASTMCVADILKQLLDIVGDLVLRSAQVVVDALLDFLHVVAGKIVEYLDTPIHFPVLSDILNALGIPDFSMLDVICWVSAVPVTILYKIGTAIAGNARAPFPDNAETTFLSETTDFTVIADAFGRPQSPESSLDLASATVTAGDPPIAMSPQAAKAVFVCLHLSAGVCGWVSASADFYEALTPTKLVSKSLTAGTVGAAFVGGVSRGVANVLIPQDPVTDGYAIFYSRYFLAAFVFNKCFFGMKGATQEATDGTDWRKWGASFDAVMVIPAFAITVVHFVELAGKASSPARTIATLDEISYLGTYMARIIYTVVVSGLIKDPEVNAAVATGITFSSFVHGCVQMAEAYVGATELPS